VRERLVLKPGDKAPDFNATDHTGASVSLAGLRGKKVWLWFYTSPGGKT
jgi:peroxiredoxin